MIDTIKNVTNKPRTKYIDNQFNICPSKIFSYINRSNIEWKSIIDFGCGHGIKALSIALSHPDKLVYGVEITDAY